jgi:putative ABC transport system permease protein
MQTVVQDAKQAIRAFRAKPVFTFSAVLALMLGIGGTAAIFSVVNAVLLRPVPFADADRLVMLMISANREPLLPVASPAQFMYWRLQTDVLEDVAAFTSTTLNYTGGERPRRINAARVSEAYFRTFRALIVAGRSFTIEEDLPRRDRVVVLSHDFWMRELAGDPQIVGKTISLSGDTYTVVGVVGAAFDMREQGDPALWVPLQVDPATTERAYSYQVAARLKPNVTLAQAQARLEASAAAFRERFPGVLGPRAGFSALTMQDALVGRGVHTTLFVLLGAVGLVLLIACANVGNLLLARANARQRELAIRSALGASRGRIARQLLTESALLAAGGGALGLIAGFFAIRGLLAVNTAGLPRLGDAGSLVGLDWRVGAFTLAATVGTVLVCGLWPALASSRADVVEVIKSAGNRAGSGVGQSRTRSALVIAEIALAVVLLIGAALLLRTSLALGRVEPGFDAENLLTMQTSLSGPERATTESSEQTVRFARERIRSVPGVVDVVATCCIPMQPGWGMPFNIPGRADEGLYTGSNAVVFSSPGYFDIFNIPVLRGRAFDDGDRRGSPPVAVINEALAKRYWPDGADPLEDRMLLGGGAANMREYADEPVRQIVGIVGDVRAVGLADEPEPMIYVPSAQLPDALSALVASRVATAWVVRTQGSPMAVSRAVQQELERATGSPATDVRTMADIVSRSVSRQRLHMLLINVFAGCALLLATIGIFGLTAYTVQQQTREVGIRIALGARADQIRTTVLRRGASLVGVGCAIGLAAAFFLAKFLASILFGVEPRDTAVFAGLPAVVALVAALAVFVPAQWASRVNPLDALRDE